MPASQFDGERILIHMVDGVMRCFTRNCNDYTLTYKPILDKIRPLIQVCICVCTRVHIYRVYIYV